MRHDTYYDVQISGGVVQPGDYVLWVRKDMADANPGSECDVALSTTATPPDHGGLVRDVNGVTWSELHLLGDEDAVHHRTPRHRPSRHRPSRCRLPHPHPLRLLVLLLS